MTRRGLLRFLGLAPIAAPAAIAAAARSEAGRRGRVLEFIEARYFTPAEIAVLEGGGASIGERVHGATWSAPRRFLGELVETGARGGEDGGYSGTFGIARFGVQRAFDVREDFIGVDHEAPDIALLPQQQDQQNLERRDAAGQLDVRVVERVSHHLASADVTANANTPMAA